MTQPNVTILGAGIIGLATASVLVSRGCSVTIIDKEGPAAGASQGNAGGIAWTDVAPLASPGVWKDAIGWLMDPLGPLTVRPAYALRILPWMLRFVAASSPAKVKASTQAIAALNASALPAWERVWTLTGTHNQVRRNGCLEVFDNVSKFERNKAGWEEQKAHGIKIDLLSSGELLELEPDLSPSVVGGAFVPGWAQMDDPKKLCLSIAGWLEAQGVTFDRRTLAQVSPEGEGARLTFADGSAQSCQKLVIACGAWSKPFAAQLGDKVPLDTERGYNITIPEPGISLKHFMMLPGHGFAVSQLETGLRLGGAVEFGGLDLDPNWKRVDAMISRARTIFPKLDASQGKRWMGFRPSMPDSLPVIDRSSASPSILYGFGHAHHGLTQAATTAEALAALIFNETPKLDLSPFSASRF
ncbi:NAD(P)/FAD-dependent oxidoreductase [Roseibium litorale]|uniref:FAD-binding oxidoreductase n=1 Tax=Roseibium litorale TaxID=2803841 RepID=A0ABR9CSZ8_9HYPH|nr:FAD-binding oxidoreductase [Roseibium litorale]MBD8893759.1 FAD-binding oxidoreductase [Roseibium litorale]